ncbi:MAG: type I-F CRISPR-associated protein Csy1 [Methylococcus sp.]
MSISNSNRETDNLRAVITQFLQERLQPKLDKLKAEDSAGREALIAAYDPTTWLADAARRVGWIQQVSHAIKFTHPSADGASLSSPGNPGALPVELGTHSLPDEAESDVVGNAAALDVYKFLRLEVDGRSLLERAIAQDGELMAALSDDPGQAGEWMTAFAALPLPKKGLASHTLARQIYWPLSAGGYHLLAPLFSSPLAHVVHQRIQVDRFSDAAKAAREAKREGKPHPHGYRDYPGLAIQKFGGSKPQNISQLNSERRGENYLLASLPPLWRTTELRPPMGVDTVFLARRQFGQRREVRHLLDRFRRFLQSAQGRPNNLELRDWRQRLLAELCEQVLLYAAELHELAPGWSAHPECRLNQAEQCWLDPARTLTDEVFAAEYRQRDWQREVARNFANWLNHALATHTVPLGGPEALEWQASLEHELDHLREDLSDD